MGGHEQSLWGVRCEKPFSRKSKARGKEPEGVVANKPLQQWPDETGMRLEGCEAWRAAGSSKLGWKQPSGLTEEVSSLEPGMGVHAFTPRT